MRERQHPPTLSRSSDSPARQTPSGWRRPPPTPAGCSVVRALALLSEAGGHGSEADLLLLGLNDGGVVHLTVLFFIAYENDVRHRKCVVLLVRGHILHAHVVDRDLVPVRVVCC